MNDKNFVSAVASGSLLTFAAFLGAFATIPAPTYGESMDQVVAAASDSDMNSPADNDTNNSNDTSNSGGMTRDNPSGHAPTADQAGNSISDRDIMSKIRKSVMADNSLSTSAHNVKIIARNGKVTLKGSVASDDEKQTIESKASEVVGDGMVVNKLTVKNAD